jgi:porphobilinogen synthase
MPPSSVYRPPSIFPSTRLRRTRMQPWCRELVAEHRLHPSDLIWPVFIQEGKNAETPIESMPGVSRLTIDILVKRAKEAKSLGIPAIAIFPSIDKKLKTPNGKEALNKNNLVCRAIRELKNAVPEIGVIADVALDPYTSHGQDGIFENNVVQNDATVEMLCKQALVQAKAGCDIVAPSDMMDGRIGAIRAALEEEGFCDTLILSYAAKYASSFYGPFRDAVGSASALKGDKKNYQMDPRNGDEAMREIALDVSEGADMVMVKPGIAYLDIVQRAANSFDIPVLAYQVSGEYAMIQAAAQNGWIDGDAVMLENLLAFKRAGARAIFTYAAIDLAKTLHLSKN